MTKGMKPNPDSLRQRVLALLEDAGPMSTDELAAQLGEDRKRVKHATNSLLADKLIRSGGAIVRYEATGTAPRSAPPALVLPSRPRGPFDL